MIDINQNIIYSNKSAKKLFEQETNNDDETNKLMKFKLYAIN